MTVDLQQLSLIAQELKERSEELRQIVEASDVVTEGSAPDEGVDRPDASRYFEDHGAFYDQLRAKKLLGATISKSEFEGCETIISACAEDGWRASWVAYALATTYHETAHTMQPVAEYGNNSYFTRQYDIKGRRPQTAKRYGNTQPGDGIKYRGRGYVQLTWKNNYAAMTTRLQKMGIDVDLVANPDIAMEPRIAAAILVRGMREGIFTGRAIDDDLPSTYGTLDEFMRSRDVINGTDDQRQIAGYALTFQEALRVGGYKPASR